MSAVVVPTGTANLASVLAALRRAGAEPRLAEGPDDVATSRVVVLPGVGHFQAAMRSLDGLEEALRLRVQTDRPLLAICLGLQVLLEGSEEAPGVPGLGVIPGVATRFDATTRCPHLGWTPVHVEGPARFLEAGYASFAHSYRLVDAPPGWTVGWADHGGPFVAALERGHVLACQLHPELSGAWGSRVLARWLAAAEEA